MPWRRFVLVLAVGLPCLAPAARAILIQTGKTPVAGFVVGPDDGPKLVIRSRGPDGQERTLEYDRAKIKILHQVDRKRLAALSPDNPKAYRDYAEELAGKRDDPEARYTAMRLYLIAAHLNPKEFGAGSLLAMSRLAGTPAEARRFAALAFVLDPRADASLPKTDAGKPAQPPRLSPAALQNFLKVLEDYRTGQVKAAKLWVGKEGVDQAFRLAPGALDKKTFLELCNDAACPVCKMKGRVRCPNCNGAGGFRDLGVFERCQTCKGQGTVLCTACDGTGVSQTISDDVLRSVLRDELWAVDQLAGAGPAGPSAGEARWSAVLRSRQVAPVAPLSLETITEFDPSQCLYRNRAWVAP